MDWLQGDPKYVEIYHPGTPRPESKGGWLFFYFTNARLIGRSVWNSRWEIGLPGYSLLSDEQEGMNRLVASVKHIQLCLRTYSNSGN